VKVLIVDATPMLDAATQHTLYLRGYTVQVVRTTAEAVILLAETSFDCDVVRVPQLVGDRAGSSCSPGLPGAGRVLNFQRITTPLPAVLASAASTRPSGVVHSPRPQTVDEFIDLSERTDANRLSHCGQVRLATT
jgi:hypothetical protein